MQFQFRSYHNHRAPRVINTLAEQVLPEAALFAFEHVRQALELMVTGPSHRSPTPSIVNEGVTGFLQHALFVADDDLGRAQLQQTLEAIVAVDDTPIQI